MQRGYEDPAEKPLFGEPRPVDRALNLVVGSLTGIVVLVTLISAFAFQGSSGINPVNVYFAIVIVLICASHLVLIYWYRQGDLEPRFRKMIYYNAFTIILLSICGNLYIHGLGCPNGSTTNSTTAHLTVGNLSGPAN